MRHVVICDDEQALRKELLSCLERLEPLTGEQFQTTCFSSGEELLDKLPADADILLLDIQMGAISGMEAARALRERFRDLIIIFITSQVQYALEGYAVHAFGFLRKPVQFGQFRLQMTDALRLLASRQGAAVSFRAGGESYQFNCNDIYAVEAHGHSVTISFREESKDYAVDLGELEEQLGGLGFARCHKSVLVNLSRIRSIGGSDVVMRNGKVFPLSRHRRQEFLVAFSQQTGGGV